MNYIEFLKKTATANNSIVCLGLDPVIEDIPEKGTPGEAIRRFYETMIDAMRTERVLPAAVKPNYAFYAQYGIEGIEALRAVIDRCREAGLPVILDAKRGDIGKTAEAYAREVFDFFRADAVTLSPFMGHDSVKPYPAYKPDGGFYLLNKTSNSGSADFQDLQMGNEHLYTKVAKKIVEWHRPGMGAVVGATYPAQLAAIAEIYIASGKEVPLLIPGVGTQGGDLKGVLDVLKKFPDIRIHRINSSSAINFAYKKKPGLSYAQAAVEALRELNGEISGHLGKSL